MNKYIQGYRNKKTDKQTEILETILNYIQLAGFVGINILYLLAGLAMGYWLHFINNL